MANIDAFRLVPRSSSIDRMHPEGEHRIDFLDVMVKDQPLRELIRVPEELAPLEFGATSLRDDIGPRAAIEQLDRFLGRLPGDFDDGRVALYLCPIDGDLLCGAVSVEIVRTPEAVTWRKLGWEKPEALDEPELTLFHDQSFTFDRRQYEEVLEGLRSKYAARMTPSEVARNAVRRFLQRGKP
ncbi:hypothetical protein GCM10027404_32870 [Arthrobacter tumbae]|uniref:hypothetical protein n=1 Tax=Arthrobacter tumbae TaxID=163874 RepID=UPI00195AF8BF|nr:hypothetical protein [Arthrobacter tumbae]MBM7781769.1 hypothetical protein [Arthrobacter tumbae]